MSESPQREEELFAAALALPMAERQRYLEQASGGDAELLRRVEALLRVHEEASDFLETPAVADLPAVARAGASKPPPEEAAGTMIGRYKLLQKIGEGGCGVVYMAEQKEPVQRRVALKVIRLGMDTREVIARFEAERQALALMDHPNIARVFDAGATDTGRPYFVMELVRGVKITDYCDQQNLSTAERLNLFVQVCHAVQHAHQKGIIHRDIKPSNILVTLQDGEPAPKVIDFGIAKATQGRLTNQTLFTAFEQFIGTPAYMSPEQAELSSQDVDTRSDIYSLGVLLYELLTGRTPFEAKELLKAGLDEMRRQIREVEPPKPSTRLRTLEAAALTTTAQHRSTEPPNLIHLVHGDLDWIVMCCLEKNRARRYETANELARDLERHLHDEPVAACPPSTLYRFQKLVRRNKLVVTAVAAIAAALVIGLAVSSWMYSREKSARERAVAAEDQQRRLREQAEAARAQAVAAETEQSRLRQQAEEARTNEARQRALAEEARNNEAHQRELAEADRKKAETEASKSQQVAQFLKDMLNGVGPGVALGRDTKLLREILDRTAERVGRDFKDQPAVEAELRGTLGDVYRQLGEYEKAETMCRAALTIWRKLYGEANLAVAGSLNSLAEVLAQRGDRAGAEAMYREALAMERKLLGNEHRDVAMSLNNLAVVLWKRGDLAGAETMQREALAMQRKLLGNEHPDVAMSINNLAMVLWKRGDYAGAEGMYREALAMQRRLVGNEHPTVAICLNNLASVLSDRGDLAGAETMQREALAMERKLLGNEHPGVATSLNNLATVLLKRGDYAGAEPLFREALAMERKLLGNEHPDVATSLGNLAMVLWKRGNYAGAEPLFREALAMQRKLLGNEHPDVATTLGSLGALLMERRDYAEAAPLLQEALGLQRRLFGPGQPSVAGSLGGLSRAWLELGEGSKAEAAAREALAINRKLFGDNGPAAINSLGLLAEVLSRRGDIVGSDAVLQERLAITRRTYGEIHPEVASALSHQGSVLYVRGDLAGAETALLQAWKMMDSLPNVQTALRGKIAAGLALCYERWKKSDPSKGIQAAEWEQKLGALTLEDAFKRPPQPLGQLDRLDPAARLSPLDNSGWIEYGQQRFPEAEPYFREELFIARESRGDRSADVAKALNGLGWTLYHQGRYREAEAAFRKRLAIRRKLCRADDPDLADALHALGTVLLQTAGLTEAEPLLREALAIARKYPEGNRIAVAEHLDILAEVAGRRGDLPEAEALLAEAYKIVQETPAAAADAKYSVVEKLAALYNTWEKTDPSRAAQAAEWRKKLDELKKTEAKKTSSDRAAGSHTKYAISPAADFVVLRDSLTNPPSFAAMFYANVILVRIDGQILNYRPNLDGRSPHLVPLQLV